MSGRCGGAGSFAENRERAAEVGRKGGKESRRGPGALPFPEGWSQKALQGLLISSF